LRLHSIKGEKKKKKKKREKKKKKKKKKKRKRKKKKKKIGPGVQLPKVTSQKPKPSQTQFWDAELLLSQGERNRNNPKVEGKT